MSYYKYMVSVYRSTLPDRSMRSSSVERTMPLESARFLRASTIGPCCSYTSTSSSSLGSSYGSAWRSGLDSAAMPFNAAYEVASQKARDIRAYSLEPVSTYRRAYVSPNYGGGLTSYDYKVYDVKVMDYASRLDQEESTRRYMNERRSTMRSDPIRMSYSPDSYRSRYDNYSNRRFDRNYLYQTEDLNSYKHYRRSNATLNERCARAKSPLNSREIDRYYKTEKRSDYMGDVSSGAYRDFRYYNYRSVPYFGGSDHYQMLRTAGVQ